MTRAEILARTEPCLWSISPRERRPVTEETCLVSELWLHGPGIVRLGELLEEEFSVTLNSGDLVELALFGPKLGSLLDLIEGKLDAV